jgi:hypothetical protein
MAGKKPEVESHLGFHTGILGCLHHTPSFSDIHG